MSISGKILVPRFKGRVFKQTDAYSCGARAIQTVLHYHGMVTKYSEIKELAETDQEGTTIEKMEEVLNLYKLKISSGNPTIKKVIKELDLGNLVLILWNAGTGRDTECHVVVLYGHDDSNFFGCDSALPPCSLPILILSQSRIEQSWKSKPECAYMITVKH
jgi:ABC-type bacteriocin/lantibiotic exporter with double-glycine peptidase domain